jgi:hypothetical protein
MPEIHISLPGGGFNSEDKNLTFPQAFPQLWKSQNTPRQRRTSPILPLAET